MPANGPDPPAFSLDVTAEDGVTTVAVAGEVDLATTGAFGQAIGDGLAAGAVTIDLREVTFMDSTGVRALNAALREATERGRELRVRPEMHPSVVQILEITGMMGLLTLEDRS